MGKCSGMQAGELRVGSHAGTAFGLTHPCHCGRDRFRRLPGLDLGRCEVVRCTGCGQFRTAPEPAPESLAEIYSEHSDKYAMPDTPDRERSALWESFSVDILRAVEGHVSARGALLDIGCGFGDLLVVARDRGWSPEGLDVNPGTVRRLRADGFTMHDRPLAECGLEGRFDAVVANQVLEHVARPNEFLAALRACLKPGGAAYIGVPCFTGPIPLVLKRGRWYALVPDEHVWQFGPRSLRRLLARNRLGVVWAERGCSGFWGTPSARPVDLARWVVYKSVDWARQGDFLNVVVKAG